ncbi:MAG: hypothetical protein SPL22_06585 [Treponema sp.]|uniref:hypothetical protein n=1 Tax=Treponema sp. TaxID=166 RepID=UPI002A90E99D|nr:hypothetical protein [Treponema sp.]MDY6397382.1 hypothetical protein [Treponema sp.]
MNLSKFVFCAFALSALFNISCSKKDLIVEEVMEPEPVESFVSGKILSKKAGLCLFGRDEQMHTVIKLSCGDDISVLEIDGVIDTKFVPDSDSAAGKDAASEMAKTAISTSSMTEKSENAENLPEPVIKGTEYVHVVHENMDFWLENTVFALNCENAVAIEKTFLYSDSALSQKIESPQNPLKFAARIAKSLEETEDGLATENPEAAKVFYYDTKEKSVREAYVLASSISARIDDIVVSQVAEELKVTKRAVPRNELFARAAKYKPCKKVLAALNAQKEEKKTYSYQQVLKSVQRMNFGVNVDELMTVDQSKDPFK